jgi:hypothetical protein
MKTVGKEGEQLLQLPIDNIKGKSRQKLRNDTQNKNKDL